MLDLVSKTSSPAMQSPSRNTGFCWYYLDFVGENGCGVVVIWGLRNPFLPFGEADGSCPSLSIVVYEQGRKVFNLHQVYAEDEMSWGEDTWRLGDSVFEWKERFGQMVLTVSLDCVVPGQKERLQGNLCAWGLEKSFNGHPVESASLGWQPFLVDGRGEGVLDWGEGLLTLKGLAYFDSNWSANAVSDLGIRRWCWGRLSDGARSLVWFRTEGDDPQSLLLVSGPNGTSEVHQAYIDVALGGPTRFGTRRARQVVIQGPEADWRITLSKPVEDGPYYQRHLVQVDNPLGSFEGVVEFVFLDRMDLPVWNRLVPMAIHRTTQDNSWWLTFFAGRKTGRWSRLFFLFVRWFFGGKRV